MKRNCIIGISLMLFMLVGLNACDKKPAKQEKKVKVETKAAETPAGDIFFYTSRHRAEEYIPTEEKMGFGSQILSINPDEFKDNKSIKEVWVSPKIKHIANNDDAFNGCSALKSLNVDVYTIGLDAFRGCTSLETARFGEHIYWIRNGAFGGCSKLRSILMAITMQKLEDGAFDGCTSIEEFSIPNDFKNRMFGLVPSASKWKKIYLLSTEYYKMPKNCTPNKNCTLYVPDAFLAQFKADADWMQFGAIEPLSKSKYFTKEGFLK